MFNVSSSISQNTGVIPFHFNECVAAKKLKGVVITSPFILNAAKPTIKAIVAFVNKLTFSTSKYSAKAFSNF